MSSQPFPENMHQGINVAIYMYHPESKSWGTHDQPSGYPIGTVAVSFAPFAFAEMAHTI